MQSLLKCYRYPYSKSLHDVSMTITYLVFIQLKHLSKVTVTMSIMLYINQSYLINSEIGYFLISFLIVFIVLGFRVLLHVLHNEKKCKQHDVGFREPPSQKILLNKRTPQNEMYWNGITYLSFLKLLFKFFYSLLQIRNYPMRIFKSDEDKKVKILVSKCD